MCEFADDEVLHSCMARLRGKYCILALKERRSENPDPIKIQLFRKRGLEISIMMRTMFSASAIEKEIALRSFILELRRLDESSNLSKYNTRVTSVEKFKMGIREVMTSTIYSLLVDMSQEQIAQLLEAGTPEELVDWRKEVYDREFDLNVDELGVAGANELAWHETMAIFNCETEE